ncbi:MAG: Ig-like domain-containing protein [Pseudomonadota bacterium]
MQNKQKLLKPISAALLLAYGVLAQQAQAALPAKPVLNFTDGVNGCQAGGTYPACNYGATTVTPGSYFTMDLNNIGVFDPEERIAMENAGTGITLDTAQVVGAIDLDWSFGGRLGRHHILNALAYTSTGVSTYAVNMTGWTVNWGQEGDINMGAGAAAILTCAVDCTEGDTFTLDYTTVVPTGSFAGINYQLHLEGVITVEQLDLPVSYNVNIAELPATSHSWIPDVNSTEFAASALTCSIAAQPSDGTATVQADCSSGLFTPTNGASFTGTSTFTYIVNDTFANSNPGSVTAIISNTPPPACKNLHALSGSAVATETAGSVTIDVTDTNVCTDADDAINTATLTVTNPSVNNASVTVDTATGVVTYIPATGFAGSDTFTYTVQDNTGGTSTPAIVNINVVISSAGSPPSTPDGTLTCGDTANAAGSSNCAITMANIGVADNGFGREQGIAQSCVGGCFDFTVSGLTAGSDARVVLPLSTAIPAATANNAGHRIVYRKLMSTGWQDFVTSDNNAVASAAGTLSGTDVACPAADDASYINGLTAGNRCVRLTITDGGPNDADGLANGTVVDPGGISETFFTNGSDGCSMSATPVNARERADWWLVAGFLGLLGLFRLRNKA